MFPIQVCHESLLHRREFYYHTAAKLTTPDPSSAAAAEEGIASTAASAAASTVNPAPWGFHPAAADAGHYYDPYGPYLPPPGPQQPPQFAGFPIYKARASDIQFAKRGNAVKCI